MKNNDLRADTARGLQDLLTWAVCQELIDIPVDVRQQTVLVIADDLAAMLSAEDEPQVHSYHQSMLVTEVAGSASLFRRKRSKLPPLQAALGNALSASWNELDEGYRKAVCHAGLYTLPVLLAVAESENLSTSDVIRASTLSYEVTARFARTWPFKNLLIHPHALFNVVGATAAIGFLRRLPSELMIDALSNASTLGVVGPYSQAVRGALIRNAWAAAGIFNGFQAIEWAKAGIAGLAETPHDVYHEALGSDVRPSELTVELGTDWAVSSGYHKMNACCHYAHSAIEAVTDLLKQNPHLKGGVDVAKIEIQTHRLGLTLNNFNPATTLGAKFSMPHALASTIVYGHGGAQAFGSESINHEQVARLRQQVEMRLVEQDMPWPQDRPAYVKLTDLKGRHYQASCLSARGGYDRPFSDTELWTKIDGLSSASAPGLVHTMQTLHANCAHAPGSKDLQKTWGNLVDQFFNPTFMQ